MVRVKYRYLVLKYSFNKEGRYVITSKTLGDIVKEVVFVNYGEVGLAVLGNILVIENLPTSNMILFRVPRDAQKAVKTSLKQCKSLGGCICSLDTIFVSGTARNAKKKLVQHLKELKK